MKVRKDIKMNLITVKTSHTYEPRPDFTLEIGDSGDLYYFGRYYVGVTGAHRQQLTPEKLEKIRHLTTKLKSRNARNYLKSDLSAVYELTIGKDKRETLIDRKDAVSRDYIVQILETANVMQWILAKMNLYMILNHPSIRSKEMALVMAVNPDLAMELFLNDRTVTRNKDPEDFITIRIGNRPTQDVDTPVVYFSYIENQIRQRTPTLELNKGPRLAGEKMRLYLFISTGKRYNDPSAAYFLVLGRSKDHAHEIFIQTNPHFMMPGDFQIVDLKMDFVTNPLFTTHIPISIR